MTEIKALEKLRKLAKEVVDARWGVEFDRAADELEAEIEERYMPFPVDADGVPIRIGDEVRIDPQSPTLYEVAAVGDDVVVFDGMFMRPADECRHVKPRTVEDVLADLQHDTLTSQGEYAGEVIDADMWNASLREQVREAAAELREIIGRS